jgi:hypothetical protein
MADTLNTTSATIAKNLPRTRCSIVPRHQNLAVLIAAFQQESFVQQRTGCHTSFQGQEDKLMVATLVKNTQWGFQLTLVKKRLQQNASAEAAHCSTQGRRWQSQGPGSMKACKPQQL